MINPELLTAYRYHRRNALTYQPSRYSRSLGEQGAAVVALRLAREDVAAGKKRYYVPRTYEHFSACRPFKRGSDTLRYVENPGACGLREVGEIYDIAPRLFDHNGWYADSFCESLIVGVVYQLNGRNGHARMVPGYVEKDNDGVVIDIKDVYEVDCRAEELSIDMRDYRDCLRAADRLAELAAEEARHSSSAFNAGNMYHENVERLAEIREEIRDTIRAARATKALPDKLRALVSSEVSSLLHERVKLLEENETLVNGEFYARDMDYTFDTRDADMVSAFNDGAQAEVIK